VPRPLPNRYNELDFALALGYFLKNRTMPRTVNNNDTVDFDCVRKQNILFGNLIRSLKVAKKKYGQLRDGVAYEIEDWMGSMAIGISDARKTM
jgi:hypothetical protein